MYENIARKGVELNRPWLLALGFIPNAPHSFDDLEATTEEEAKRFIRETINKEFKNGTRSVFDRLLVGVGDRTSSDARHLHDLGINHDSLLLAGKVVLNEMGDTWMDWMASLMLMEGAPTWGLSSLRDGSPRFTDGEVRGFMGDEDSDDLRSFDASSRSYRDFTSFLRYLSVKNIVLTIPNEKKDAESFISFLLDETKDYPLSKVTFHLLSRGEEGKRVIEKGMAGREAWILIKEDTARFSSEVTKKRRI